MIALRQPLAGRPAPRRIPDRLLVAMATVLLAGTMAEAGAAESPVVEHPALVSCRAALAGQVPASERPRIVALDLGGTRRASEVALLRRAVDHALRRVAPLALAARRQAESAARLRRLPRIDSHRSALAARRVVLALARALPDDGGAAQTTARPLGACEQVLAQAALAADEAARGEARDGPGCGSTARVVCAALAEGAEPAAVAEAVVAMLRDLVVLARSRANRPVGGR